MNILTNKSLGVKLINTLNKLEKGHYELKKTKDNVYHVVLYNNTDYGVYAAIYNEKHKYIEEQLLRLDNTIQLINIH